MIQVIREYLIHLLGGVTDEYMYAQYVEGYEDGIGDYKWAHKEQIVDLEAEVYKWRTRYESMRDQHSQGNYYEEFKHYYQLYTGLMMKMNYVPDPEYDCTIDMVNPSEEGYCSINYLQVKWKMKALTYNLTYTGREIDKELIKYDIQNRWEKEIVPQIWRATMDAIEDL